MELYCEMLGALRDTVGRMAESRWRSMEQDALVPEYLYSPHLTTAITSEAEIFPVGHRISSVRSCCLMRLSKIIIVEDADAWRTNPYEVDQLYHSIE
nr:hypothetical protein CFP56_03728 [Quercus suber]